MIYEEDNIPVRFSLTAELAFIFDAARQYPNYPEPYILCQKWKDVTSPGETIWVKVPVIDLP